MQPGEARARLAKAEIELADARMLARGPLEESIVRSLDTIIKFLKEAIV